MCYNINSNMKRSFDRGGEADEKKKNKRAWNTDENRDSDKHSDLFAVYCHGAEFLSADKRRLGRYGCGGGADGGGLFRKDYQREPVGGNVG